VAKTSATLPVVTRESAPGTSVDPKSNAPNKVSQQTNGSTGKVAPALERKQQPEQQLSTDNSKLNSQVKLPQTASTNDPGSSAPLESETKQSAPKLSPTNSTPNASVKQPQPANANTELKTTTPNPPSSPQPEPREEARTVEKTLDPKPASQPTPAPNANSVAANAVQPESALKPETQRTPPAKTDTNNDVEQKAVGAQVSLNAAPAPRSLETRSVSPTATSTYGGDASWTKIYRVGPSDVLDVQLNDSQSPKSTLFTVTPSGLLEHPLLNEPLAVTGLTVEEIGAKLEGELSKRALIENPRVIVGVRDYASHPILVSGLVKDSGTKFLRREAIPLYVVVADAQPLPEATRVTVVRSEVNQIYEIELTQAADMNLLVRSGDVVTVLPSVTQFIYIGGEVKSAGEKTFRRGLTLTQVILAAGGVTPKARVAQIVRDAGGGFLVPTRFDLQAIGSGKAADPLLKPGDRIVILR
jgi:protein involved in polysaccharide export with SLBB domain